MLSLEFLKFVKELHNNPPDNPKQIGYTKLRALQEARVTTEDCGCPDITQKLTQIGGIQAEWLIPEQAPAGKAVVYIHGGSWGLGSIRQTRLFLAPMVQRFRVRTVHFDYRLMPEHPFPAGLDDCLSLYLGLLQSGWRADDLILAGESAGANLALALMLRLKEERQPLPGGAVLMSPITVMDTTEGSHQDLAGLDLILSGDSFLLDYVAEIYAPGCDKRHPWLSPLYGNLSGLPSMQLYVGTDEKLFDDTLRFYRKSRLSGNQVELIVGDHMCHSWPIFLQRFPEAEQAVQCMADFIWQHLMHVGQEEELHYENFLVHVVLDEVEHNYAQASLSKLAYTYNQTLYGYSKLIKRRTGYTFKQLLKNRRFAVVERQLTETNLSIKTIAASVGYENLTHFYDLFRKKYGKTPQQFRTEAKQNCKTAKTDNDFA